MELEIRPAAYNERLVVRHLMELYQHDFSELDGTDLDDYGQYGYYDLDCYWINPNFVPYVLKVDGKWAGFALVNDEVYLGENSRAIGEFFVARKYRRHGVGKRFASAILRETPASWEICIINENPCALAFWQKLLTEQWPGRHHCIELDNDQWQGPVLSVDTRL